MSLPWAVRGLEIPYVVRNAGRAEAWDSLHNELPGMAVCQRDVGVGCVTARSRPDPRRLLRRRTTRMLFGAVL
jgi:hypothetical protein